MSSIYKLLDANDRANTKTLLHEAIPITGSIVSGTYYNGAVGGAANNIKDFGHQMFQKIYDYPYLSSSANDIFDISVGWSNDSAFSSSANTQNSKKINIYNSMAQILMGHDTTGSIQLFDNDGDIAAGGLKIREAFFLTFSRLLVKDEIKKGSFRMTSYLDGPGMPQAVADAIEIGDYGADTDYRVNSPAGEYGVLYRTEAAHRGVGDGIGLIFYQAGVAVVSSSLFTGSATQTSVHNPANNFYNNQLAAAAARSGTIDGMLTGTNIPTLCDGLRNRIKSINFNNTTEVNSTVYFCRLHHNEFNYSSNPTYVSGSRVRCKTNASDNPIAYVTGIGLYSTDNALLAVAKLSEPLKKSSDTELTLRVRLDY